ncbi:MAG: riboflavin synthase subunit alpha [Ketobacteraceae bacterium]|nr:riboflavin synthase subunit alpha [Ketobacteraceae bacterium]
MFTGIVQGLATVEAIEKKPGLHRVSLRLPTGLEKDIVTGASIAVNGVCMTVTGQHQAVVHFDAMAETLGLTSLGDLKEGDPVNVERSARQGDEIGGHLVSGHVDGMATIVDVAATENNRRVTYKMPDWAMVYLFKKGFIALDGCSLTIADIDREQHCLTVCYIPETLRMTVHGQRGKGDRVNFEIDRQTQAIVETVRNLLRENPDWIRQLPGSG